MIWNNDLLRWSDQREKKKDCLVIFFKSKIFFFIAGLMIFSLLAFLPSVHAQQEPHFEWVKQIGGHRTDKGNSVAADAWGNVYTTGQFFDTADFNPGGTPKEIISNGGWDMFLTKRDAAGNLVWVKTIGSYGMDVGAQVVLDDSGNIYVTGQFSDMVNFNPGGTAINLTAHGYFDIFVAKFDSSGKTIWAKGMGGKKVNEGHSLALDGMGNLYVTGDFQDTGDFNPGPNVTNLSSHGDKDIFITKLTTAGDFLWSKSIGGSGEDIAYGIAAGASGNIYLTGHFNDTVDFDPGPKTVNLISNEKQDMFVAKIDSSGTLVWAGRIAGASFTEWQWEYGFAIALDHSENVYTTGSFSGTVDFDPDPSSTEDLNSTLKSTDVFLLKLDSSGKYVWAKNIGGRSVDEGKSVFCNALGDVYLSGYFNDVVDFDPGTGTDSLTSFGGMDIFAAKFDAAGNFLWAEQFGGAPAGGGGNLEEGYSIVTDARNNVYITGYFEDKGDFDPGSNSVSLTSNGNEDVFLVKLSDCISMNQPFAINGTDSVCPGSTYTYTASGINGAASYTWQLPQGASGSSTTDSITVTFGSQGGIIKVTANGFCDTSAVQELDIDLSMIPPVINVNGFTLSTATAYATYQWLLNDNIIPGATDSAYAVMQNGDYKVIVSSNSCTDTSGVYTVNNYTGIENVNRLAEAISIYPNPAHDIIHIVAPVPVNITLTGLAGKVIRRVKDAHHVSIKDLASGLYLLRITDENGTLIKVEKIAKQEQ